MTFFPTRFVRHFWALFTFWGIVGRIAVTAQSSGIPLHAPVYALLERFQIKTGIEGPLHTSVQFFHRKDAADYALQLDTQALALTRLDRADLAYLLHDNSEWVPDSSRWRQRPGRGLFKTFYKTPPNFFEVNTPDFTLRANPMLNVQIGAEQGDKSLLFLNQRGLEVRGTVDGKFFFYTNVVESQARFPAYVRQRVDALAAVPGAGLYKSYQPRILDLRDAYDYYIGQAYMGVQLSKHVGLQLGHGQHFIGNGYRSHLLSDVGAPTFYLKLNTRVWRFHYENVFMELSPSSSNTIRNTLRVPRKFVAAHYLDFRVTPRFSVGLFEATVFNRDRKQFELQYLNPIILYRTVEGAIGSPDNVLIGANGHWDLFRRFRLYGQLMLDEFLFSSLVNPDEKGWWGNKYALQAGCKWINAFGVDHLDMQAEWNYARPYIYSHSDSLNSYTHYNQPLAHPLWSNFKEVVMVLRYQPHPRLLLSGRLLQARFGENTSTENWGALPLLSNNGRLQDYENTTTQGVSATLRLVALDASWQLYHNVYMDLRWMFRHKNSEDDARDLRSQIFSCGFRMNMWPQALDW